MNLVHSLVSKARKEMSEYVEKNKNNMMGNYALYSLFCPTHKLDYKDFKIMVKEPDKKKLRYSFLLRFDTTDSIKYLNSYKFNDIDKLGFILYNPRVLCKDVKLQKLARDNNIEISMDAYDFDFYDLSIKDLGILLPFIKEKDRHKLIVQNIDKIEEIVKLNIEFDKEKLWDGILCSDMKIDLIDKLVNSDISITNRVLNRYLGISDINIINYLKSKCNETLIYRPKKFSFKELVNAYLIGMDVELDYGIDFHGPSILQTIFKEFCTLTEPTKEFLKELVERELLKTDKYYYIIYKNLENFIFDMMFSDNIKMKYINIIVKRDKTVLLDIVKICRNHLTFDICNKILKKYLGECKKFLETTIIK